MTMEQQYVNEFFILFFGLTIISILTTILLKEYKRYKVKKLFNITKINLIYEKANKISSSCLIRVLTKPIEFCSEMNLYHFDTYADQNGETETQTYITTRRPYIEDMQNIVGIRATGLPKGTNILSRMGYMERFKFDPSTSNTLWYAIIIIEVVLNGILMWSILREAEPSFLFEPQMWGWYALTALFFGFYVYLEKIMMGHYALMYSYNITEETIEVEDKKGNPHSLTIPIYWVRTYFYPAFDINEVLKLNPDEEQTRILNETNERIFKLSSDNQSLNRKISVLEAENDKIRKEMLFYKQKAELPIN